MERGVWAGDLPGGDWRLATGDSGAEAGERGFEGRECRRLGGDGEKEKVGFGASE
jgi:hypothetical protein